MSFCKFRFFFLLFLVFFFVFYKIKNTKIKNTKVKKIAMHLLLVNANPYHLVDASNAQPVFFVLQKIRARVRVAQSVRARD